MGNTNSGRFFFAWPLYGKERLAGARRTGARGPSRRSSSLFCAALATCAAAFQAQAREPVEIGFIATLSTPAGYLGQDQRDAFDLAIRQGGGTLGGVPVRLVVEDDGLKPAHAKQIAEKMVQAGIQVFTGITFGNVIAAAAPTILKSGAFYVSLNTGPSNYAGSQCNPRFFSVAMQNDSLSDTTGVLANELGVKRVVVMAPNYQTGRDTLAVFKRIYKGEVVAELYTKMNQADFSVEIARIRALKPDAIFQFLPGGLGINFAKQFANSGLNKTIKVLTPVYSMDDRMLAATGDAGEGYYLSAPWAAGLDNPANKKFVADFEKAYKRTPTVYAAQAYDTARLIAVGLKAVDGDVRGKPAEFRAALRKADIESVRGHFKFGPNQYPVQDWLLLRVVRQADGKLGYKIERVLVKDHGDPYAKLCKPA